MNRAAHDMTLDQLADFAKQTVEAIRLAPVRMAVDVFRLGEAMLYAKSRLKGRRVWSQWQEKHELPRATVNQAIRLFKHFKTEEALEGKTIMVAKREAKIIKKKVAPEPVYVPANSPRVVLHLERTIHALDNALQGVKDELDTLDRSALAKLARELEKLATDAAQLAKSKRALAGSVR